MNGMVCGHCGAWLMDYEHWFWHYQQHVTVQTRPFASTPQGVN